MPATHEPDDESPASDRYLGETGRTYYEGFQRTSGRRGAALTLPTFQPHVGADDRVVDFGCGGGWLLELLDAGEKVGIEVNPTARAEATARGLDTRRSLTELPDGYADVVISNHALEHTREPFATLRDVNRVLRAGGRLVIVLPIDDWHRRVDPADINGHLFTWAPQTIFNLLTEAGFVDVRPTVSTFAWPPRADLLAKYPPVYRVAGTGWSIVRRIRETRTTARKP